VPLPPGRAEDLHELRPRWPDPGHGAPAAMIDPRARRTERVNRARIALELRRAVRPALVVATCMALGLALTAVVLSHVAPTALSDTYTARFELRDATGVTPGVDQVRFKGVPVGQVTGLGFRGATPVATVKILRRYGPIYGDLRAQLRPTTALQDMYLDI